MKIVLGVEYDGQSFFGWQFQKDLSTIQGCLQKAISQIAAEPVQVFCAGRTDAGVHATSQVIHFETKATRVERAWTLGVNTHLPSTIAVRWMREVDDSFHARFSAIARRYRYVIYNHSLRPALFAGKTTWYYHALNVDLMQKAAAHLLGEHDFSSFRSAECESKSPMRNMQEIVIIREGDFVILEIQANAFLHHMVRNIVGVLMQIGSGFKPQEWILEVLHAKDRRAAAQTAPAAGLYLNKVQYPERYFFPRESGSDIITLFR